MVQYRSQLIETFKVKDEDEYGYRNLTKNFLAYAQRKFSLGSPPPPTLRKKKKVSTDTVKFRK